MKNSKGIRPQYTYDEMIQRIHDGSSGSIDIDKAVYQARIKAIIDQSK